MPGYVTLVYTAKGAPSHLAGAFVLKGRRYVTGEEVEVPPELAGLIIKSAIAGSVRVVSGQPINKAVQPTTAKAAAKQAAAHRRQFPVDPARALDDVPALPDDVMAALSQKRGGTAYIESGAADACLANVAVYLKMVGRHQLARAAARRAESLKG